MQFTNHFQATVRFLFICSLCALVSSTVSCTTSRKSIEPLELKAPLQLQIKPTQGREEKVKYRSHSLSKTFDKGQVFNEKEEIVDFTVLTKVDFVDEKNQKFNSQIETIEKDGTVDLTDLAFPEKGDVLLMESKFNGKVLRAGDYPENSVYFVPSISIPKKPVRVGDTWEMTYEWINLKNGMPMRLELVTILKNVYSCGSSRCADLEVSGNVSLPPKMMAKNARSFSILNGRILYNVEKSSILWSEIRNHEELVSEQGVKVDVISCLESKLISPEADVWTVAKTPQCNPAENFKSKIPGT